MNQQSTNYKKDLSELRSLHDFCLGERNAEYLRGERNSRFLKGQHHTDAERKDYIKDGLIPYSIPLVATKLNRILAEQRSNRRQWQLLGRGQEDELGAEILTGVFKYIDDLNEFGMTESDIYKDGSKLFGCVEIGIDKSVNPQGEISLKKVPYYEFLWDSNSIMYDLSDATFVQRMEWMTKKNVKTIYDKDVQGQPIEFKQAGIKQIVNYYRKDKGFDLVCVITHEERFTKRAYAVKNLQTGDTEEFKTPEEADAFLMQQVMPMMIEGMATGQQPQFNTEDFRKFAIESPRIRRVVFTGTQILEEEEIDSNQFSYIPYFQLFDDGEYYCLLDLTHDSQKWFDRLVAMIDRATVKNIKGNNYELVTTKLDPSIKGNVDNELKKLSKGGHTLKVLENNALLPIQTGGATVQQIEQLAGVQSLIEDLLGGSGAGYSPSKIDQTATEASILDKNAQMTGFLYIDNLRFWKKLVGQKILELIPQVYTKDRQVRINGSVFSQQVMNVLKTKELYAESEMNPSLGWVKVPADVVQNAKVDLIVSEAEPSDTMRMAQANMLMSYNDAMIQRGYAPIPPEILLVNSKLPPTVMAQLQDYFEQQQQAQAEAQAVQQKMQEAELTMKGIESMHKVATAPTSEEKQQELEVKKNGSSNTSK